MPSTLAQYLDGLPQNLPYQRTFEPQREFTPAVPSAPNASITAHNRPYRNGNLPDPTVGGFSENVDPTNGHTIDQNYSPRVRAAFLGQGHYDLVPVPTGVHVDGPGTPNTRFTALRQGALQQLMGSQRNDSVTALQFASALSGYSAGILANR